MERRLKVLLIEDSHVYRQLIESYLDQAGGGATAFDLESYETLSDGLGRLSEGGVDAVLLDLFLPDSEGIGTLWRTLAHPADVAIIVLTGHDDENLAVTAVQRGAQDYLGKEQITAESLARSIRHAVERKRLQTCLESYANDLSRFNRDLQQFTFLAVQRLNSPIHVAAKTFEFLLENYKDALDTRAEEQISSGLAGITRIRRLLEDFVNYVNLGSASPAEEAETDCEAAFAAVTERLDEVISKNGAVVTHDDLPTVKIAETDVAQLFERLLENAIAFRREEEPRIHLGVRREADSWVFSMSDNGMGIEPEYPGQIFEAFQKLERERGGEGTGIGLAICKRLVERNGGNIWVESQRGKGSIFHFTIPTERRGSVDQDLLDASRRY